MIAHYIFMWFIVLPFFFVSMCVAALTIETNTGVALMISGYNPVGKSWLRNTLMGIVLGLLGLILTISEIITFWVAFFYGLKEIFKLSK